MSTDREFSPDKRIVPWRFQWTSFGRISGVVLSVILMVVRLHAADVEVFYQPSTARISNPERGFYVQITANADGQPLSGKVLKKLRGRGITLILRMYYLKEFRDKPLSQKQLDLINQDFTTLRQAGCKCILRFAYSSSIGDPDAPMQVIMQHIDQLEPLLRDNADVIAVVQAGFIGAWGELHSSTNGLSEPESICVLLDRLLKALPSSRSIQVRTPMQKQACVGTEQSVTRENAFGGTAIARIGHHNDCFLAGETDLGTYDKSKIGAQKRYLALDTRYVPMGGETCRPSEFTTVNNARSELSRMHWTYLNRNYHPEILSEWRTLQFLEEVESKLGYRLALIRSSCSSGVPRMGTLSLSMQLENTGWAAPINPRDVYIVATHEDKTSEYRVKLRVNPQLWLPDQPIHVHASIGIPKDMPTGKYQLYLLLADPEPRLSARVEYAIQLANEDLWDEHTGKHDLKQTMTVSSGTVRLHQEAIMWFESKP